MPAGLVLYVLQTVASWLLSEITSLLEKATSLQKSIKICGFILQAPADRYSARNRNVSTALGGIVAGI